MRFVSLVAVAGLLGCPAVGPEAPQAPDTGGSDAREDVGALGGEDAGLLDAQGSDRGSVPGLDAGSVGEDLGVLPPEDGGVLSPEDAGGGHGEEGCGGIQGLTCDRGLVCDPLVGMCQVADAMGICVPLPEGCDRTMEPVCGCDGVTYNNDCLRLQARAALDHEGACEVEPGGQCGGFAGLRCPGAMDFCDHPQGTCQMADGMGQCVQVPRQCGPEFNPVCGCNGETYDNDCRRLQAGVQLDHQGVCADGPPVGDCQSNRDCGRSDYCAKEPGQCAASGSCEQRPDFCPEIFDPVCGCDDATYGNNCVAASEGVNVKQQGACQN